MEVFRLRCSTIKKTERGEDLATSRRVLSCGPRSFVGFGGDVGVGVVPAAELWRTQIVTGKLRSRLGIFQEYYRCRGAVE